jgi:hypothetical protein
MSLQIPQEELQKHLQNGEQLLWSGRPADGIRFRKQDIFLVPFSLMWGGFAIFWEFMVTFGMSHKGSENAPLMIRIMFPLWGIPFVIAGLYLIFGRFLFDAKKRSKTFYGVTNQRIIILSGLFSRNIKSLNLKNLTDVSMDEKSDGTGTITFGPSIPMSGFVSGSWPGTRSIASPCFEMVDNVSNVYKIISDVQRK